jgi:hypothetical protein
LSKLEKVACDSAKAKKTCEIPSLIKIIGECQLEFGIACTASARMAANLDACLRLNQLTTAGLGETFNPPNPSLEGVLWQ